MKLGQFSISLAVKDIHASRKFYEALGFEVYDDHEAENWLILQNGEAVIGLFQGMFEKNIMTFNPNPEVMDVREIQRRLKESGLELGHEADETTTGPDYLDLVDPDGNPILIDQHDPNYKPTSAE
jgi:lactoylglutathione lyase